VTPLGRKSSGPAVIGSDDDTVDDRTNHIPAWRFEELGGLVWLIKLDGTRYAFAGRRDLPGWLAYYRSLIDALERFLEPPSDVEEVVADVEEAPGSDEVDEDADVVEDDGDRLDQ
jgi:hypothetical protein